MSPVNEENLILQKGDAVFSLFRGLQLCNLMNINPLLSGSLMNTFIGLDAKHQNELMSKAYLLTVEQTVENELREKLHREPLQNETKDALSGRLSDIVRITEKICALDETGQAFVALAMEKLHPTSMSVKNEVVVTTTHCLHDLDYSLKETMPNADLLAAHRAALEYVGNKNI